MIRVTLLLLNILVGCDAISQTKIQVGTNVKDLRNVEQVNADILSVIDDNAARFDFRKIESYVYTDRVPGENPSMTIVIGFEEHPVSIQVLEMFTRHPSQSHRNLAASLIEGLKIRNLDAAIIIQTPPASNAWLYVIAATVVIASGARLIWRRVGNGAGRDGQ